MRTISIPLNPIPARLLQPLKALLVFGFSDRTSERAYAIEKIYTKNK